MADHVAKIPAHKVCILVSQHVGLDVAEARFRLVPDAIVKRLNDVFLEMFAARKGLHDGVARGRERTPIHTLLIAGSPHAANEPFGDAALRWLKTHAPLTRRFGSVCTGAFMLAAAGLIDRNRVTTHWAVAEQLARAYRL